MARERASREGVAYSGGSQLAVPFPGDDDQREDDTERDDQEPDDQDADDDNEGANEDDGDQGGRSRAPAGGRLAGAGAGWVLGILLWGWLVLPFVKGGPAQVKKTLQAKFLNRSPDGSPLP